MAAKSIMEFLRDMREDHDLTQAKVASVLGITQQRYSHYETERTELPLPLFIKLCEFYDISADYLIWKRGSPKKRKLKDIYLV